MANSSAYLGPCEPHDTSLGSGDTLRHEEQSPFVRLSNTVLIRSEYFGALLFDKQTLAIIEVNKPTTRLLSLVDGTSTKASCGQRV